MPHSKTALFIRSISFSGDGKSNLDKSNLTKDGKQVAVNVDGKGAGGDSDSGERFACLLRTLYMNRK